MTTLARANIASTSRAACRTGNKFVETPIRCIVMPGYSLPPTVGEVPAGLAKLTAAELQTIVNRLLRKESLIVCCGRKKS